MLNRLSGRGEVRGLDPSKGGGKLDSGQLQ